MGLDWNFYRITSEQHNRLLGQPTYQALEAIHNEWFQEGYQHRQTPDDDIESFDRVYSLGLRTFYDDLDTLMTWEGDDGPKLAWPLGETGVHLPARGDMFYILAPEEVQRLAPILHLLNETYLEQRYAIARDSLEAPDLFYSELQICFADLTHFVGHAAAQGEALMWELS